MRVGFRTRGYSRNCSVKQTRTTAKYNVALTPQSLTRLEVHLATSGSSLLPARSVWRTCLTLCALVLLAAPASARASLLADRLEISMYGRVGLAWSPVTGKFIQGKTMNLTGGPQGGRLEEGDYLEPTIRFHLLEPKKDDPTAAYADVVLTPAMFANNGLFIGTFGNRNAQTLQIELFQAYAEAGNILAPGLKLWAGARFYRGADVHIADYFYFNNLTGQGVGVTYGPLDVAVLLHTSASTTGDVYNFDSDGDGKADLRRQRTMLVGQYVHKLEAGHSFHLLGEFHLLPELQGARLADGTQRDLPSDFGWVAGIKGHFSLGGDNFNDVSVRYGSRIASGSRSGSQTWDVLGPPGDNRLYSDAAGLEVVDHFLFNVSPLLSLNAYGILHWNQGTERTLEVPGAPASTVTDRWFDYSVGARSTLYLSDYFHLINEATYQGLRVGNGPMSNALKLSLVPTIVPTGQRSVWARPHLRLFYTIAFYDEDAVANLVSPYLQTMGGGSSIGHYVGARAEWWF
ncbi:carbohydrate porin [Archangium minus]|uniref:Carbohydrate porin n=1 Tax=Archangium minus TaxID=83450 RepID=A0ABY9X223_9BACT|nr:carbohydrate porin [Archangium minus]